MGAMTEEVGVETDVAEVNMEEEVTVVVEMKVVVNDADCKLILMLLA